MSNTSSISILHTVEWSKRFNGRRPLVLGNYLEPALTNANTIIQTILSAPFAWRWNRVVTGFVTVAGQQDYFLFNWQANFPLSMGSVTVDTYGNSQYATTGGNTGSVAPTWSNIVGGTTVDGGIIWVNKGSINAPVSQTYDFGWIETSSVQEITTLSPLVGNWYEMESKICLGFDSKTSRPRFISAQGDDGQGNITFRLTPVPSTSYPVVITMQQKPTLLTSINDTWAPIPDEYSRIYNWGFLCLAWLFSDDPRFSFANQKFVTQLLSVNDGLTDTEKNIFLGNWQMITGAPMQNVIRTQQGDQARSV